MNGYGSLDRFQSLGAYAKVPAPMGELPDFERRIERLRTRASRGPIPPELRAEIQHALDEGYVLTLRIDARSYRLREQLDALVGDVDTPPTSEEVSRLVADRRMLEQSARRLRADLGILRSLVARSVAARTSST
jgi:hypothetical protein